MCDVSLKHKLAGVMDVQSILYDFSMLQAMFCSHWIHISVPFFHFPQRPAYHHDLAGALEGTAQHHATLGLARRWHFGSEQIIKGYQ